MDGLPPHAGCIGHEGANAGERRASGCKILAPYVKPEPEPPVERPLLDDQKFNPRDRSLVGEVRPHAQVAPVELRALERVHGGGGGLARNEDGVTK